MSRSYFRVGLYTVLASAASQFMLMPAVAQVSEEVLDSISTPDQVETSIGTLEFFDGIPTRETAELLYDNLDLSAGCGDLSERDTRNLTGRDSAWQ